MIECKNALNQGRLIKLCLAESLMNSKKVTDTEVDIMEQHLGIRYFRNHSGHMVFREINKQLIIENQPNNFNEKV